MDLLWNHCRYIGVRVRKKLERTNVLCLCARCGLQRGDLVLTLCPCHPQLCKVCVFRGEPGAEWLPGFPGNLPWLNPNHLPSGGKACRKLPSLRVKVKLRWGLPIRSNWESVMPGSKLTATADCHWYCSWCAGYASGKPAIISTYRMNMYITFLKLLYMVVGLDLFCIFGSIIAT